MHRLKELSENDPRLLRIGVKSRGCSGLVYNLEYVKEKGKLDETITQEGVTVLIDGKALFLVLGSTMDYREDDLAARFVFENPNVKETCGCGESFLV